ncbi:unnamed protein product [Protopolystoma xenopodis]|uniref:RH2 domain-containing protein n=1 Tax=Protopolystoma xenopodis TaxID=117903 RepID=A0A3S5B5U3_9PLAT|nr:unnamed protein product [Protopolystoma xenopodis]
MRPIGFTRHEMRRVIAERNHYKERLIELQEAVRFAEILHFKSHGRRQILQAAFETGFSELGAGEVQGESNEEASPLMK